MVQRKSKKSITAKLVEQYVAKGGKLPLQVLLDIMSRTTEQIEQLQQEHDLLTLDVIDQIPLSKRIMELEDRVIEIANKALPFIHPKLTSVELPEEPDDEELEDIVVEVELIPAPVRNL